MSTQADVNRAVLQVTPENVLQVRAVLLAEADRFHASLTTTFLGHRQLVGLCGGDPVSHDAQALFSRKIRENALAPAQQYVRQLRDGADRLAEVARSFGFSEQRISGSFRPADDPPVPA